MITLGVANINRAIEFYHIGLGLPMQKSSPEVAFFNLNGTWLGLYGTGDLAKDAGVRPQTGAFHNLALAHNLSSKAEVDKTLAQAAKAGAKITQEARKTDWGGYAGYFQDPDGHLWELAYNPFFWIGPLDE